MADMTVDVNGTRQLAEGACRMVFGEDTSAGPVCPVPPPLLKLLEQWPRDRTDEALNVALDMPVNFDIAHEMARNEVKAVVLRLCRVTVLHRGQVVGHALRTDAAGLNALAVWRDTHEANMRRIRQAH